MRRLAIQGSVTTLLACALICACGHEAETHAARDAGHVSQPVAPVLPDAGPTFITHTVEEGETLWDIAQAYGIRSRAILVANHLDARDVRRLAPGMTLRIPGATSAVEVATARDRIAARETERAALPPLTDGAYYTLVRGDTLSEVAERFNLETDAIIARNELIDDDITTLRDGRTIILPGVRDAEVARRAATRPRDGVTHTLARGETVWDVASAFQMSVAAIMAANSLSESSVTSLREGAPLFIPGVHTDRGRRTGHRETPRQAASRALARRLGLGTRAAAGQLLYGRVRPEWAREAERNPRARRRESMPGTLRWPVAGGWFVRGYGSGEGHYHQALDIAGNMGWNVRASASGIVGYAGNEVSGYGNMVMVIHPGGWVTMYAHNSVLYVVAGQRVAAGTVLAELGSTGISRGPHVHFELSYGGQTCDPAPLMRPGIRHRNGRIEPLRYSRWTDAADRPRNVECDGRRRHPHSRLVIDETPEAAP
ncbi:MAG: LysM peptidoglycan-binding domain-containing M23 family metallopeptidase [Sandaracinaceae bacterium]|nr:LysM peptidoglycan-binding domain-containing M23 family metallopeptidase [Sandaracinaceae bacterium]